MWMIAMAGMLLSQDRAAETEMGRLAASMKPGTWAELKTAGIVETLKANGASGAIFGYSEDGAWDPETRRFLYLGGNHNGTPRFVSYSADDNTWRTLPQPAWIGKWTMHGYDHNAIDPASRVFYHFPFGDKARTVRRYKVWHTNAVPVSTYGVVMFVKYYHRDPEPRAWVYLYKPAK